MSTKELLPTDSYTYISEAWHTTSWLDHCISTADGHAAITDMRTRYELATTDHIPIAFKINVEALPSIDNNESNGFNCKLDWSTMSKENLDVYYLTNV